MPVCRHDGLVPAWHRVQPVLQSLGARALRLRNLLVAHRAVRRQRLHAQDESLVAQVHLLAQVVGPERHVFARRHQIGIRPARLLGQRIRVGCVVYGFSSFSFC